jgi:hypothetical protein
MPVVAPTEERTASLSHPHRGQQQHTQGKEAEHGAINQAVKKAVRRRYISVPGPRKISVSAFPRLYLPEQTISPCPLFIKAVLTPHHAESTKPQPPPVENISSLKTAVPEVMTKVLIIFY